MSTHFTEAQRDKCSNRTRGGPEEGLIPLLREGDLSLGVEGRMLSVQGKPARVGMPGRWKGLGEDTWP